MLTFVDVNDKDINAMDFDRYFDNRNDSFGLEYNKFENKIKLYDLVWGRNGQPAYCGTIYDITLEEWDNMSDYDRNELIYQSM